MDKRKADYGIDAPHVVRNLFLFSLSLAVVALFSFCIPSSLWFWIVFLYSFFTFLALFATGCWMLYGIKVAKPKIASQMIQNLRLQGDEKVLDLGCGRGLLLCKIAQCLPCGEAHGIDLWSHQDQSGNSPEKTLENADREGVKDKVIVHTGDTRALPFSDHSFDAIVSSLCLHNIKDKKEREKALREMLRVLKPGGKFAIADIQHVKEYAEVLSAQDIQLAYSKSNYSYCPPIRVIEGRKK